MVALADDWSGPHRVGIVEVRTRRTPSATSMGY